MTDIRVLLVDDHLFYREGVRTMLGIHGSGIDIVAEADSGEAALELAATETPDVILMDLQLPQMNGIEVTRRLHAAHPEIAILVLTLFDDDSVFAALRAGARGYLLKQVDVADLTRAIVTVHRGQAIFSPAIADRLGRFFAAVPSSSAGLFPELTARETEVLQLIASGTSTADIARNLSLTPKTVRNYVASVLSKLQVTDRASAAERARAAGLGAD